MTPSDWSGNWPGVWDGGWLGGEQQPGAISAAIGGSGSVSATLTVAAVSNEIRLGGHGAETNKTRAAKWQRDRQIIAAALIAEREAAEKAAQEALRAAQEAQARELVAKAPTKPETRQKATQDAALAEQLQQARLEALALQVIEQAQADAVMAMIERREAQMAFERMQRDDRNALILLLAA